MDFNVEVITRETFHSSLRITEQLLMALGMAEDDVQRTITIFRRHDKRMLKDQHAFYDDEGQMIQTVLQAAPELDSLFRSDRESHREASEQAEKAKKMTPKLVFTGWAAADIPL